jgi:hypothetical protein
MPVAEYSHDHGCSVTGGNRCRRMPVAFPSRRARLHTFPLQ